MRRWILIAMLGFGCGQKAATPAQPVTPEGCVESVKLLRFACKSAKTTEANLKLCEGLESEEKEVAALVASKTPAEAEALCKRREEGAHEVVQSWLKDLNDPPPGFQVK